MPQYLIHKKNSLYLDSMHICTYNIKMDIEWDGKKAITNLKKHGIDFADVVTVLEDERAISISEEYSMKNVLLLLAWIH